MASLVDITIIEISEEKVVVVAGLITTDMANITTLTIITNALLIPSNRPTTSRRSSRRTNILLKVRTILIVFFWLLIRGVVGAYENLDFENWDDLEQQLVVDALKIDNSHDIADISNNVNNIEY